MSEHFELFGEEGGCLVICRATNGRLHRVL